MPKEMSNIKVTRIFIRLEAHILPKKNSKLYSYFSCFLGLVFIAVFARNNLHEDVFVRIPLSFALPVITHWFAGVNVHKCLLIQFACLFL
jgi:hypothetical protein